MVILKTRERGFSRKFFDFDAAFEMGVAGRQKPGPGVVLFELRQRKQRPVGEGSQR